MDLHNKLTQHSIPDISLRHLRAVFCVAQYRNVTRASEELNLSQAAVSKAVADVEQQLGVQLFNRTPAGLSPTVFGEVLASRLALATAEFAAAGISYAQFKKTDRSFSNNPLFSMNISYKRLAALITLWQTRSYPATAEALNISTSAVYNSIREIEALLDTPLFKKDPSGVKATPYCDILARHVKQAFAQVRHAINEIASVHNLTTGQVTIGTLPYTRTILTPRAINRLLESQPQLDVSTIEGPYDSLVTLLLSGDIDLIVGATRSENPSPAIMTERLLDDELAVIARSGHPLANKPTISPQDLEHLQWVLPAPHTPSRDLFEQFCEHNNIAHPQHFVQTSSLSMVRGLLLESDRVALLSEHQIYIDNQSGALTSLPVELTNTSRPIGITMLSHTHLSPVARLFLESIRAVAAEMQQQSPDYPALSDSPE